MTDPANLAVAHGVLCIWLSAGLYTFAYIVLILNNQGTGSHETLSTPLYYLNLIMSVLSSIFGWPFLLVLFEMKRRWASKKIRNRWLDQKGLQLKRIQHASTCYHNA